MDGKAAPPARQASSGLFSRIQIEEDDSSDEDEDDDEDNAGDQHNVSFGNLSGDFVALRHSMEQRRLHVQARRSWSGVTTGIQWRRLLL